MFSDTPQLLPKHRDPMRRRDQRDRKRYDADGSEPKRDPALLTVTGSRGITRDRRWGVEVQHCGRRQEACQVAAQNVTSCNDRPPGG